ncbi:MAG: hypothetical protein DMF56_09240 [Acidobacteria bacterium]|nr:MAG: hypothetical protein DMF56_09240 [Acidobacteriota bacterium]
MLTFFRRLARVVIRPRTTMREILDEPRDRMIVPLLLLATLAAFAGDPNNNVRKGLAATPYAWLIVICALIVSALVVFLAFYLFSWIAYMAGRFLDGQGSQSAVRSALAWGFAPIIWAMLYRIPIALFASPETEVIKAGDVAFRLRPALIGGSCALALIFGLLELAMIVAYVVVSSRTLAEAHRFSAWKGFGTLVIVGITPLVIIIAAVLAIR